MVNETTICHKCGYEGFHYLFERKNENGEIVTTDRKSACISDIEMYGLSKARDIAQERRHFDAKMFCPKCNYVNGSEPAIDSAYNVALRNRQLGLNRKQASGCLGVFLVVTVITASLLIK